MESKDYLIKELSKEEKLYLERIIMTAKNKYIQKNIKYFTNINIDDEMFIFESGETVLDTVLQKCQEDIDSAVEFEKTLSNPSLYNIIKALSLREKEVLFYLYKKQKPINEIAQIMNIDRKTVRRIRDRAHSKIAENLIKGDC